MSAQALGTAVGLLCLGCGLLGGRRILGGRGRDCDRDRRCGTTGKASPPSADGAAAPAAAAAAGTGNSFSAPSSKRGGGGVLAKPLTSLTGGLLLRKRACFSRPRCGNGDIGARPFGDAAGGGGGPTAHPGRRAPARTRLCGLIDPSATRLLPLSKARPRFGDPARCVLSAPAAAATAAAAAAPALNRKARVGRGVVL